MNYTNRIRELREDNDKSQREISKVLNVSQQQYSRYETETSQMTYEQLKKLAVYYNVSVDYILYNTDERKPYPKSIMSDTDDKVCVEKICHCRDKFFYQNPKFSQGLLKHSPYTFTILMVYKRL